MKLSHITLNVNHMEESLKFYNKVLGLPIQHRFTPHPTTEIVFLGDGDTAVELICHEGEHSVSFGEDISIGFGVESLEATRTLLSENGISFGETITVGLQTRFFFAKDPNGVKVQFIEQGKPT